MILAHDFEFDEMMIELMQSSNRPVNIRDSHRHVQFEWHSFYIHFANACGFFAMATAKMLATFMVFARANHINNSLLRPAYCQAPPWNSIWSPQFAFCLHLINGIAMRLNSNIFFRPFGCCCS